MTTVPSNIDPFVLNIRGASIDLRSRTHVMGILNVTPDSFSDGGKFLSLEDACAQGIRLEQDGADILDIGGESSRPGADPLSLQEELDRVIPVIEKLSRAVPIPISIDTYKERVADEALRAGASIINDITAMTGDSAMARVVREHRAPIILMHMRGTPRTMQVEPKYENVTSEVTEYLRARAQAAKEAGAPCVIVDPGIGFGKTLEHNLRLLRELPSIAALGFPVLVGPSRKSFLGAILGLPADQRLEGTAAAVAVAVMRGAHIVRVHDVREMKRIVQVVDAVAGK